MSRFGRKVSSLSWSKSPKDVRIRLVLVYMVGQTPLMPSRPVHCPPRIGACSKIVGSNPCDSSQRAATSPPGPAPITATLPAIGELSHDVEEAAACLSTAASSNDHVLRRCGLRVQDVPSARRRQWPG